MMNIKEKFNKWRIKTKPDACDETGALISCTIDTAKKEKLRTLFEVLFIVLFYVVVWWLITLHVYTFLASLIIGLVFIVGMVYVTRKTIAEHINCGLKRLVNLVVGK